MKTHYFGKRDGFAYCGAPVPTSQLTAHQSSVTCQACLRHLKVTPRKPIEERKEGRRVTTASKAHWAHLHSGTPICGELSRAAKVTLDQGAVTCGRCTRLLGIKPTVPLPVGYADSILRRAFKDAEGEMAVALVEAEKALAGSLKPKPHHEIIAELSGALRRLLDLLGSKTSN